MDKYEYKVRADEIKDLIGQGEYAKAAEIADTIDWRKVKSVMMLCTISDLYKINRRYEEARDMLLLAYDRRPGGRTICYALCELSIKIEDIVQAVEFYKEFVQVAPSDSGRYILQYKIYEAQEVSLEERIEVLEELKQKDYREKWAYELAYLYHRVGLATRCVEECDELILWFGEGRYVTKAMELKMLHQPLSPSQQEKYDNRFIKQEELPVQDEEDTQEASEEEVVEEADFELQAPEYLEDTLSGPSPLAEEVSGGETKIFEAVGALPEEEADEMAEGEENVEDQEFVEDQGFAEEEEMAEDRDFAEDQDFAEDGEYDGAEEYPEADENYEETDRYDENMPVSQDTEELDIHVKTMDVGEYNTINLQAELAAGLQEVLADTAKEEAVRASLDHYMVDYDADTDSLKDLHIEDISEDDVEETGEIDSADVAWQEEPADETEVFFGETGEIDMPLEPEVPVIAASAVAKNMEEVLWQEADGQIGLVIPEEEKLEKQITGQMSIEDILSEWERMKQQNQERHQAEIRQRLLEHTGEMFTEFEANMRDGLLERLEKEAETDSSEGENLAEVVYSDAQELPAEGETLEGEAFEDENNFGEESFEENFEEGEVFENESNFDENNFDENDFGEESFEEGEVFEDENNFDENNYDENDLEDENFEENIEETDEVIEETDEVIEETESESADEEASQMDAFDAELQEAEAEIEAEEEDAEEAEDFEGEFEEDSEEELEENFEEESVDSEEVEDEEDADEAEDVTEEAEDVTEEAEDAEELEDPVEKEIKAQLASEEAEEDSENASEDGDSEEASKKDSEEGDDQDKPRHLTEEEQELYEPFIQSKESREQLVHAIDNISMASYTGNLIITGDEGMDTLSLAKNVVKEIQAADSNFSGKVAKISGNTLNKKNVAETFEKLRNGALIIEKSSEMNEDTVQSMYQTLQRENMGIVVIMEDSKRRMNRFLNDNEQLTDMFTARIDVEALSNDALVAFGKKYARELEYSIDDFGILALHTRIESMQTSDHVVTVSEVKEIVDEAIAHADRKTLGHFFDVLLSRRYDDEDMIVLSEKDFV